VRNSEIEVYHRYGCIRKNIVYIGVTAIHGFRHALRVMECLPHREGGPTILHFTENLNRIAYTVVENVGFASKA